MSPRDYDAFISHSSEDQAMAGELAGALIFKGFRIWYDRFVLRVGDNLLAAIEQGLTASKHGILLISPSYLSKAWTSFEMDTLIRQSIETGKKLLPIWHGVTKAEVNARHPGLAGIYALTSGLGIRILATSLSEVLAEGIPTRGLVPPYESPVFRFICGKGELRLGNAEGPAFTLWEALLFFKENEYPLSVEGEIFDKGILLWYAAEAMARNEDSLRERIGDERFDAVWQMCQAAGIDPATLR